MAVGRNNPRVFVSYSHDSPAHKLWVANLATRLMQHGIYVIMDQWDLRFGDDIAGFAERGITSADYVLVICSRAYVEKAERAAGGVGFETQIISSELPSLGDRIKYIPILRDNPKRRPPSFLADRVYLDFTEDDDFDRQFEVLLRQLYAAAPPSRPPVGATPPLLPPPPPPRHHGPPNRRNQVFISYSHADKRWLKEFQVMLAPLIRSERIQVWDDTMINAGNEWREEINKALRSTKVAVLIVTPDFLASDFIAENELPPLLDAASSDGITVLWVAASSSFYAVTEIAKYQAANNPARPLDMLSKAQRNKELVDICKQVLSAYEA